MIIGGTFDNYGGKTSMIVKLLAKYLSTPTINGGTIGKLTESRNVTDSLTIWMPNVDNRVVKIYPQKARGSILICSKVMRTETTIHDAVARIFKMNGNAVITITVDEEGMFKFALIDALGNVWIDTHKVAELAKYIKHFQQWMLDVRRAKSVYLPVNDKANVQLIKDAGHSMRVLCDINKDIADKVELSAKGRYFGNASTRCELMFPSIKMNENYIYVSKRNVDKERLTEEDFILCTNMARSEDVVYLTDDAKDKPSVDTPIQLQLYSKLPNVMCMIHGHAYIKGVPTTQDYWPCGDLREVTSAMSLLEDRTMCINLKNHGFLAVGTDLNSFDTMLREAVMTAKIPGQGEVLECTY